MRFLPFLVALIALSDACSPDADHVTAPTELRGSAVVAGNPALVIHVDDDAQPGGNGSGALPFANLPAAVDYARTLPGRVTIKVEPGDYALDETLVIDRSIELRGSTEQLGGADSWPSGEIAPRTATRVFASSASLPQLVLVDRGDGGVLTDVEVRGFVFEGTATGISLLLQRAQGYWIADNVFRAPGNFAMVSVASSGRVSGNHFSGVGTGMIFNGGYPASPSSVVVQNNRAIRNRLGGLLLNGASIGIPELGDAVKAVIRDNDLSENVGNQGFGLRIFIIRRDLGAPGDGQSSASVYATVEENRISDNRVGIYVDAGFPYRLVDGTCDTRVYSGTMELQFAGNAISGSLLTPALVTFTRSLAALNSSLLSQYQYLHDSRFTISDPKSDLAGMWIDHPAADPFVGPCLHDDDQEPLGNRLLYNGQVLSNGKNF